MAVFLANRSNIQLKALHRRIKNRFQSIERLDTVRLRVTNPRERGRYRVVARTNPQSFLEADSYPVAEARIEVGFEKPSRANHEHYWFNWIEPDQRVLLGWHRDDDHPEYGEVHIQITESDTVIAREPATFIDMHPMAVVEARLEQLPAAIDAIEWHDESIVGLNG